jgi:lysophospholipase L1-like esterase
LVIDSSSTVGLGATSASKIYVERLERDLESAIVGVNFTVVGRGISGEVAQGAADRMRREVEEVKPDLVIWQVGTNDALSHVAIDRFRACLQKDAVVAEGTEQMRGPERNQRRMVLHVTPGETEQPVPVIHETARGASYD